MSNIATPRRTELDARGIAAALTSRRARIVITTVLFAVLMISLRPFGIGLEPGALAKAEGGDVVNQIGFTAIGLVSAFCLATMVNPRVLAALLDVPLIIMFAIVFVSLITGLGPDAGLRVFLFVMFAALGVAAILVIPEDAESLVAVIAGGSLIFLAVSYFGVFFLPDRAIHQAYEQEYQHAGLWRGVFAHKNTAGPVMASLVFAGIMLWRFGWRRVGIVVAIAAGIFVLNTGSKTSASVVPMAALIVLVPAIAGQRWLASFGTLLTLALFLTFTIGIMLSPALYDIVQAVAPGTTYTGRTSLWDFALQRVAEHPWTGVGLENFWKTPAVAAFERPYWLEWDVRGSVHAHNGYLDAALAFGLPAFVYFMAVMIVRPAVDYALVPRRFASVVISDFFMMVFIFTTLNACLESFFFRRADPVWLFFLMAVIGLRLCARFPIRPRAS